MNGNGIIMYESDSLAHYGVLGMKWGHRKQRPRRSDDERAARRRKIAKGLGAAAGVAGASAGAYYLYKHGKRIKKVPKSSYYKNGKLVKRPWVNEIRNSTPNVKIKKSKNPYLKKRPHVIMAGPDIKTGKDYLKRHHGAVKGPKVGSGNNMKTNDYTKEFIWDRTELMNRVNKYDARHKKRGGPMHDTHKNLKKQLNLPMWDQVGSDGKRIGKAQTKYLRDQGVTLDWTGPTAGNYHTTYKSANRANIPNVKTHRRKRK